MPETIRPEPSRMYRWIVLIFISVAMGGNYYIYDSINPLERIFIDHLGFSATQFGWLNASYSVAAVLTLLIGGIIIDRIGTKKAITAFAVLCLLGALLTASKGSAPIMIAGRTVLGLGAESMIVARSLGWLRSPPITRPPGPIPCSIRRVRLVRQAGEARCCWLWVQAC
jgi:MFS family permease